MNALWQRVRWPAAVVAAVSLAFLGLVNREGGWDYLGIQHLRPYFFDLCVLLAAGMAWHAGLDPYAPNPFDPGHRPHVYGPWWLVSGPLGFTTADTLWMGGILVLVFLVTVAWLLAPRGPRAALVASLWLVSPPVLLALERGNNDLVVFLIFAATGVTLAARGLRGAPLGAGLLGLAGVLKLYPLASLPALAARPGSRRRFLVALASAALGCALVFALWWRDYDRVLGLIPKPTSIQSYGWRVGLIAWRVLPDDHLGLILGVALGVAGAGWFFRRFARALWRTVPTTGTVSAWFVAGALSWIFCFAINTNYTYRAVLLLLPARRWFDLAQGQDGAGSDPGVGENASARDGARVARLQLAAWLGVFWLVPIKGGLAAGIDARDFPGGRPRLAFVMGLEQAVVAGLTLALVLGVAGWAWRRWHQNEPGE